MKRDDDYIRELLFEAEAAPGMYISARETVSMSQADQRRYAHSVWLSDAGLFALVNHEGLFRLTNQGHDFLAAIRDDTVWSKTKEAAAVTGGVALSILKDIALACLRYEIKNRTGYDI